MQADATVSRPIDGRTTRWSGHRERRRAEFIEAALRTIARNGRQTSIEQIANSVGVTRTKLYRYFDGAADLHRSVARRVSEMLITEQQPLTNSTRSLMELITSAVSVHLRWRIEHSNLYEYLSRNSLSEEENGVSAIRVVNSTVAANLSEVWAEYFNAWGLDERLAEVLAYGIVGFVETAATRWLDSPNPLARDEFTTQVAGWIWLLLDNTLQAGGIHVDPHQPFVPSEIAAGSQKSG